MRTLILTPTELESSSFREKSSRTINVSMAVCGFGPVGAAVGASMMLEKHSPDRVILAGIAGAIDKQLLVGNAYQFESVSMHGIGVCDDDRSVAPHELGFAEFENGDATHSGAFSLNTSDHLKSAKGILTVCESFSSREQAVARAAKYTDVTAEDMEGYSVAMACTLKRIPLMIIRGISNLAGDRDKKNWRIDDALYAASVAVTIAIEDVDWGTESTR